MDTFNAQLPDWMKKVLRDEHFSDITKLFLDSGVGRPKTINVPVTPKLLLQLHMIRLEHQLSWTRLISLAEKHRVLVLPRNVFARGLIEAKVKNVQQYTPESLVIPIPINEVGPFLTAVNVDATVLENCLSSDEHINFSVTATNGIALELEHFSTSLKECSLLLEKLCGVCLPEKKLCKKIKQLKKKRDQLGKGKGPGKPKHAELEEFMNTNFTVQSPETEASRDPLKVIVLNNNVLPSEPLLISAPSDTYEKISVEELPSENVSIQGNSAALKLPVLRRKLEEATQLHLQYETEKETLMNIIKENQNQITQLEQELSAAKESISKMNSAFLKCRKEQKATQSLLHVKIAEVKAIHQANFYRRLKRKEKDLETRKCTSCADTRKKLRNTQKHNQKLRQQVKNLKNTIKSSEDEIKQLTSVINSPEPCNNIQTREGNAFTQDIIKCVIALIGEEIPASRCGKVIQIVGNLLFNQNLSENDLPSSRSSLRFADMGHCIAKVQLNEVLTSQRFDLHLDGTTKDHVKYLSHQITTSEGISYSCGFQQIGTEDTSSLLQHTLDLFQEVTDICAVPSHETSLATMSILQNLSATMSDRATVMKSFSRQLNVKRKDMLKTDEDLEFLHCNAHVLLGFSAAADKMLKELESSETDKLGRDKNPQFKRFSSSEAATIRFIRLACSLLASRGDEKNGCRASWEAYLGMTGISCPLQSFRANRFNNHFDASEHLYAAREHIITFLQDYMPHRNQKLQSVLEDALDENLMKYVCALGTVNIYITKPYWNLLKHPSVSYAGFYIHVMEMHSQLKIWTQDISTLPTSQPLFGHLFNKQNNPAFHSTASLPIIQRLCHAFVEVVERQLCDFLPGGTYYDIQDPDRLQRLQKAKITNLISEQCFGDLDFSLFKRRNASTHHHGTVNMLKRNAVSEWLASKPLKDQISLIKHAVCKAPAMRLKHRQEALAEKKKLREHLAKCRQEQLEKEAKVQKEKATIIQEVTKHGGPCTIPSDVDALICRFNSNKDKCSALRAQIKYHKVVLGQKSQHLKVTGNTQQLCINLKSFLGDPDPAAPSTSTSSRKRTMSSSTDPESDYSDSAFSFDETEDLNSQVILNDHRFSAAGETIAVFYNAEYYIGQVQNVISEEEAVVNFMEKCKVGKFFRWPNRPDQDKVHCKYVFASGFSIDTSNGRLWTCSDIDNVERLFKLYRATYC